MMMLDQCAEEEMVFTVIDPEDEPAHDGLTFPLGVGAGLRCLLIQRIIVIMVPRGWTSLTSSQPPA